MKIGIDIDDTMADTFDFLMPYIAKFYKVDLDYLKDNNISYSSLPMDMKKREHEFAKKYYDDVVPYTPFKPKVAESINKIREMGHEVIVITARDETIYNDAYGCTIKELEKNNINYDKLVCDFDKATVCRNENIDLFIDDSIDNCNSVSKEGVKTILFNSKINQNHDVNFHRVNNWDDVLDFLQDEVKQ